MIFVLVHSEFASKTFTALNIKKRWKSGSKSRDQGLWDTQDPRDPWDLPGQGLQDAWAQ